MNLRDIMVERIFFIVGEEEFFQQYMLDEEGLRELSDLDFLEIYEEVVAWTVE